MVLDGTGYGSSVGGNCRWTQKLTTMNAPDVIVAMLAINDTTTTVTGFTDNAPTPLLWHNRTLQRGPPNAQSASVQILYYYAIALLPVFADNVTFALSSRAVATVCQEFGVSGADTDVPFDPNLGMPNGSGDFLTTSSVTYNTYNPNDFLVILQGFCAFGSAVSGNPSGFTSIVDSSAAHVNTSKCSDFLQTNTFYKIVSATQSSQTVSWTFDNLDSPFAIIADAIQSTPGPLSASVIAGSNLVDVGQLASFSCAGEGGVRPYTYSWTFGDGSTGSEKSTSHIYST